MYAIIKEPISRKILSALGELTNIDTVAETNRFMVLDMTKLSKFDVCVAEKLLADNDVEWFKVNPVEWDSDNDEFCEYEDIDGRGFNLDHKLALNEYPCEIFGYGFDGDGGYLDETVDPVAKEVKRITDIVNRQISKTAN